MSRWSHLEYRLALLLGEGYCAVRRVQPNVDILNARSMLSESAPSAIQLVGAETYAFRYWWRIVASFGSLLVAFGIVFDEFFYSRKNIAPFVVVAVLGALTVGALVELAIIRIRLRFLIGFESSHGGGSSPPKWMVPKFYDFWLGFVVTAFMVPVFLLGAVPSAVS